MKEKFIQAHMKAAEVYAELSTATRLHVGCVAVKNDTIIGIGYNGMPSGWTNECEDVFFISDDENDMKSEELEKLQYKKVAHGWIKTKSKPEVLHAESNCLAKIARSTNSSEGASLFVTHAPCLDCAKIIYQAGIKEVYYKHNYRETTGIEFLKKCKIDVVQVQ
jgi:dCMP deaminase